MASEFFCEWKYLTCLGVVQDGLPALLKIRRSHHPLLSAGGSETAWEPLRPQVAEPALLLRGEAWTMATGQASFRAHDLSFWSA